MEGIKDVAMPLIWLCILLVNVGALWKWNSSFVKKKDFNPNEFVKAANCGSKRAVCRGELVVADQEVKDDIRNIKVAILEEERITKALGVMQIVMCRHIGMKKEEIDMFKDALMNGADLTPLL